MERDRRTIELATTVVRQHDAVDTEVGHRLGIFERLDLLDDELVAPLSASRRAVERPKPDAPPVTMATSPANAPSLLMTSTCGPTGSVDIVR